MRNSESVQPVAQRGLIRPQVDVFVFDAAPQSLDEHVIDPATFATHTDRYPLRLEYTRKGLTRVLRPLVSIENRWGAVLFERLVQGLDTGCSVERIRHAPGEHSAGIPIHDDRQIHKPFRHRRYNRYHSPSLD